VVHRVTISVGVLGILANWATRNPKGSFMHPRSAIPGRTESGYVSRATLMVDGGSVAAEAYMVEKYHRCKAGQV